MNDPMALFPKVVCSKTSKSNKERVRGLGRVIKSDCGISRCKRLKMQGKFRRDRSPTQAGNFKAQNSKDKELVNDQDCESTRASPQRIGLG